MIHIDFFGGLHGHFLEYSINALDDTVKKIDVFTEYGTSHVKYEKNLATAEHYSIFNVPLEPDDLKISITANFEDCLMVNLLCFGRSGDYKFDLNNFAETIQAQTKNTSFYSGLRQSLLNYDIDLDTQESVSKGVLRESFKYNFLDYNQNSLMKNVQAQRYRDESYCCYFRNFYSFETYIQTLVEIVDYFKLPYTIDFSWYYGLWIKFMSKLNTLSQEKYVMHVYNSIVNNRNIPIKLNILQEAWLNAALENKFNKEMPFYMEEYFQTTKEIIEYVR